METIGRLRPRDEAAIAIIAPQPGETYALPARASARRLKTGDPELQGAVGRDWQNDYADFSIRLKKELQGIESASARRQALARMSEVLRSYQDHRDQRKAKNGTIKIGRAQV